jgi:hypothetical protein
MIINSRAAGGLLDCCRSPAPRVAFVIAASKSPGADFTHRAGVLGRLQAEQAYILRRISRIFRGSLPPAAAAAVPAARACLTVGEACLPHASSPRRFWVFVTKLLMHNPHHNLATPKIASM